MGMWRLISDLTEFVAFLHEYLMKTNTLTTMDSICVVDSSCLFFYLIPIVKQKQIKFAYLSIQDEFFWEVERLSFAPGKTLTRILYVTQYLLKNF